MGSNFHYPIDLNEEQSHQPFFSSWGPHHHASSSFSYLPFLNSPQEHGGYTYHADPHPSQSLQAKMLISSGGSCDHTLRKREPKLKLKIQKKEDNSNIQNETKGKRSISSPTTVKWMSSKMRLMKKMIMSKAPSDPTNSEEDNTDPKNISPMSFGTDHSINNGVIRVCSDCNTSKTPLWRSGPRGPKSLCNACGIRQRKARRAAMAAAAASAGTDDAATVPPSRLMTVKQKMQNKNKKSSHCNDQGDHHRQAKTKKCKIMGNASENQGKSPSLSSSSSNKLCFDDLTIILSKSSAFQQVFPQDEKEAAILLMALSYGMVHG